MAQHKTAHKNTPAKKAKGVTSVIKDLRSKIEKLKKDANSENKDNSRAVVRKGRGENHHYHFVDVSAITILKIAFIIFAFYYLTLVIGQIGSVLLVLFASAVIASALIPMVDRMQRWHIPRAISILLIYVSFFSLFAIVISNIIPFLISQVQDLAINMTEYIRVLLSNPQDNLPFYPYFKPYLHEIEVDKLITQLNDFFASVTLTLGSVSGSVFSIFASIAGGVFATVTTLVLTFYMILEKDAVHGFFRTLLPMKYEDWATARSTEITNKMGDWLRGQALLSTIIGLLVFIGLKIIGVEYALTLAILAGLFEFIPYIGPILAAIVAIFVAITTSPTLALFTLIVFMIIQALENNIIVPLVMRRAIGLNPLVTIIAILIGVKLIGGVGVVLAIPIATALSVFIKSFTNKDKDLL